MYVSYYNVHSLSFKRELSSARASRNHFFFPFFSLSPDFYELWCRLMSICLLTEVKRQWAMLVLGSVIV